MSAFLRGFAEGASISYENADAEWAAFSRNLPDSERNEVEAGGWQSGYKEGKRYGVAFRGPEE